MQARCVKAYGLNISNGMAVTSTKNTWSSYSTCPAGSMVLGPSTP